MSAREERRRTRVARRRIRVCFFLSFARRTRDARASRRETPDRETPEWRSAATFAQPLTRYRSDRRFPPQAVFKAPSAPPGDRHELVEQYWVEAGDGERVDPEASGRYVVTPGVKRHLSALARAALLRRHPILLQGPTSSGKTSLVEYLAERTGHRFVRINNHEHTDLQEYLGSYVTDAEGAFRAVLRAREEPVFDPPTNGRARQTNLREDRAFDLPRVSFFSRTRSRLSIVSDADARASGIRSLLACPLRGRDRAGRVPEMHSPDDSRARTGDAGVRPG